MSNPFVPLKISQENGAMTGIVWVCPNSRTFRERVCSIFIIDLTRDLKSFMFKGLPGHISERVAHRGFPRARSSDSPLRCSQLPFGFPDTCEKTLLQCQTLPVMHSILPKLQIILKWSLAYHGYQWLGNEPFLLARERESFRNACDDQVLFPTHGSQRQQKDYPCTFWSCKVTLVQLLGAGP